MGSSDETLNQLRVAERAAAAPYVDYPKDPWWVAPGFGLLACLIVLGVSLEAQPGVADWAGTLPIVLVPVCACSYLWWQRRRRGTMPSGRAPREVQRVLWGYIFGAVVVGGTVFGLADLAPLWLAAPAAFVLASTSMLWFGHAYDRAAARVRERLA